MGTDSWAQIAMIGSSTASTRSPSRCRTNAYHCSSASPCGLSRRAINSIPRRISPSTITLVNTFSGDKAINHAATRGEAFVPRFNSEITFVSTRTFIERVFARDYGRAFFDRFGSLPSRRPTLSRFRQTAVPAWRRDLKHSLCVPVLPRSREVVAVEQSPWPAHAAPKRLCGSLRSRWRERRLRGVSCRAFSAGRGEL